MPQPVVHFEIGCRDRETSSEFYSRLFDWVIDRRGASGSIDTRSGIPGHIVSLGHEPHNYVMVYVQVDNLEDYLQRGVDLGGSIKVPPQELPGVGRFAWLADPEGTVVGLFQPR